MSGLTWTGPSDGRGALLLAHGAGAGATSPFMDAMSRLLAERGLRVGRFEFGYMAARQVTGKRRPPPRAEALDGEMLQAVAAARATVGDRPLAIGGKSMGGRIASHVADRLYSAGQIVGLVCLGYPFHPPKSPDKLRLQHLIALACPALVVQGERDPFGSRAEVEGYGLPPSIRLHWARDGDHDLGPRGGSGVTRRANLETAADAVAGFMSGLMRPADGGSVPGAGGMVRLVQ